jgi:hypothetical protein
MKKPFKWDNYSDQPAQLKDKSFKKRMRSTQKLSFIKMLFTTLIIFPISLVLMPFVKRKELKSEEFFSLGIDFQREPLETNKLLLELEVTNILVRFKLWEMDRLQELKDFLEPHKEKKIIVKILQDRENIEDLELFHTILDKIFYELKDIVNIFEIGTTINRAKWGFFSVDEYSNFFKVAFDLKQDSYPDIKLIGSGVIDFEYHYTAQTLFNFFKYKYDGISSLLYVDRRGAPENMQLGFTLSDKIAWLSTLVWLSPKVGQELHITEVNWPITGTAPYAPTSEYECIDEELYGDFMLRYYLLTFASQQVDSVSWHQLIAPGYGLVDNREGIKKRSAFYTFKYMSQTLKSAQFLRLDIKRDYYILQCLIDERLLQIHWSLKETTLKNEDFFEVFDKNGEIIKKDILTIASSPLYIYITKEVGKKINASERA